MKIFIALAMAACGVALVWINTSFWVVFGLFLCLWADNIDKGRHAS